MRGCYTDFDGILHFWEGKKLDRNQIDYLNEFSKIQHGFLDVNQIKYRPDPLRKAVGLPVGVHGCFYIYSNDDEAAKNLLHQRQATPPSIWPSLSSWCCWVPTESGDGLQWNGNGREYDSAKWLQWLQDNILIRWGFQLTGHVFYRYFTLLGEQRFGCSPDDMGVIYVERLRPKSAIYDMSNPSDSGSIRRIELTKVRTCMHH